MAKAPKTTAKAAATKAEAPATAKAEAPAAKADAPAVKADGQNIMNPAAAEQAERTERSDPQSGMDTTGPTARERRDELNKVFEKADEKGKAAIIEETQSGIGFRGY